MTGTPKDKNIQSIRRLVFETKIISPISSAQRTFKDQSNILTTVNSPNSGCFAKYRKWAAKRPTIV